MATAVFVGRERELTSLQGYLDRALAGQGQLCFVTGNAGSGKTALVSEFARRAQESHAELIAAVGGCNAQTGIGDPYLPFRELLAVLTGDVESRLAQGSVTEENARRLRMVLVRSLQVLIEVGPDLIDLLVPGSRLVAMVGRALADKIGVTDALQEIARRKRSLEHVGEAPIEPGHVFEQYTQFLVALAAHQPLLLIIDDLQWIDAASASLLFHLGRRLGGSRILMVGTYRPADVALGRGDTRHPLESVINELKRHYGDVWVDLDESIEDEGRAFVQALLDSEPNRLGESFRQALFEHTEGHPLFTLELLRDMQERGDLVRDSQGHWMEGHGMDWADLPARVEGVIEERIGRLAPDLTDMLTVASVEGEAFTAEVVARVKGLDAREVVRQLSGELGRRHRLVRDQELRRLPSRRLSRYRFWHGLFQRYLYHAIPDSERAYLHEDVGAALEALYGDEAGVIAAQLARHYEAAGVADKAQYYLFMAGDQARALYAPREAADYYTRALEMWKQTSSPPPASLYRARGQVFDILGGFARAESDFSQALDTARSAGDHHAEWQALIDLGELWSASDYARTGEYYHQALEQARASGDAAALAHSLNRVGNWRLNSEESGEALAYHQEALAIFRQLGDRHAVAETLDLLGMASALGGDLFQSTHYYEQAVEAFQQLNDRECLVSSLTSLIMRGTTYHSETLVPVSMDWAGCTAEGEAALEMARDIGWRAAESYTSFELSFCLGTRGEYDRALEYAQDALRIAQQIGHHQWLVGAHCALGALYLDLLALSLARLHLEEALSLARKIGSWMWIRSVAGFLASTYIQQGELGLAEVVLDAVLHPDTPFRAMGQRLAWCAKGELALATGQPGSCLQIVDRLIASTANRSPGVVIPRLGKLRGEALMALQRTDEAEAELLAALEAARGQGTRPMAWRIYRALSHFYHVAGRMGEAHAAAEAASAIVHNLAEKMPLSLRSDFTVLAQASL